MSIFALEEAGNTASSRSPVIPDALRLKARGFGDRRKGVTH